MASHETVTKNWLNQTGKSTRGYAMFYDGETLYSWGYHFPLARIVRGDTGKRAFLYNCNDYSASTAKHKSIVRRMVIGEGVRYPVPFVMASNEEEHRANHLHLINEVSAWRTKAKRARVHGDRYNKTAQHYEDLATLYALDFLPQGA